jgi:hypothetical protein
MKCLFDMITDAYAQIMHMIKFLIVFNIRDVTRRFFCFCGRRRSGRRRMRSLYGRKVVAGTAQVDGASDGQERNTMDEQCCGCRKQASTIDEQKLHRD